MTNSHAMDRDARSCWKYDPMSIIMWNTLFYALNLAVCSPFYSPLPLFQLGFFWSLSCCSTTSTTCCSTTISFWSSTTCLLPRPFYCLHGFSKVPCLFCQPGFFLFFGRRFNGLWCTHFNCHQSKACMQVVLVLFGSINGIVDLNGKLWQWW